MKKLFILLFSLFSLISLISFSKTLKVSIDGSKQFTSIQSAINASNKKDTVLVYDGKYKENISFKGKSIVVTTLYWGSNQCWIEGSGNGSVVTFQNGEDSSSVLNGFVIAYGKNSNGGGVFVSNSSPTLSNLTVALNEATNGGGLYFENSTSKIFELSIQSNKASSRGGGIYVERSNITVQNSQIFTNTSVDMGAGIFIGYNSTSTLEDLLIYSNEIVLDENPFNGGKGGGIMIWTNSKPILNRIKVFNNKAKSGGGIACMYNSHATLKNIKIYNNSANIGYSSLSDHGGGGGLNLWNSNPIIINVLFENNISKNGGAIFLTTSSPEILNCTFINNTSSFLGGAIWNGWSGKLAITNSVFWKNSQPEFFTDSDDYPDTETNVSYSCFFNNPNNILNDIENNIYDDPIFNDTLKGDFSLSIMSPCINKGINNNKILETDLNKNTRVVSNQIDMGAYENQDLVLNFFNNQATDISNVHPNPIIKAYNLQGIEVPTDTKGEMIILLYDNGRTKKVIQY